MHGIQINLSYLCRVCGCSTWIWSESMGPEIGFMSLTLTISLASDISFSLSVWVNSCPLTINWVQHLFRYYVDSIYCTIRSHFVWLLNCPWILLQGMGKCRSMSTYLRTSSWAWCRPSTKKDLAEKLLIDSPWEQGGSLITDIAEHLNKILQGKVPCFGPTYSDMCGSLLMAEGRCSAVQSSC